MYTQRYPDFYMTPQISPDKDWSVSVSIPTDFSSHPFIPPPQILLSLLPLTLPQDLVPPVSSPTRVAVELIKMTNTHRHRDRHRHTTNTHTHTHDTHTHTLTHTHTQRLRISTCSISSGILHPYLCFYHRRIKKGDPRGKKVTPELSCTVNPTKLSNERFLMSGK